MPCGSLEVGMQAAGRSAGGHIKPGPVCSPKRRKVYNRGHERRTVRVALNPLRTAPSGSVEAEVEDKPFLKDALLDAALPLTRKHINFFKFALSHCCSKDRSAKRM
jgi:hypothetical protein